jgi:hypothetical protein
VENTSQKEKNIKYERERPGRQNEADKAPVRPHKEKREIQRKF